ncbi:MAG: hypothetical protein V1746_08365 [bacterium]
MMRDFNSDLLNWLMVSGYSLFSYLPSGLILKRIAAVTPERYNPDHISTEEGAFQISGQHGLYLATSWLVAYHETRPTGACVGEIYVLNQNIPHVDTHGLPQCYNDAIRGDRDLPLISGKHAKTQLIADWYDAFCPNIPSGFLYPSRRTDGAAFRLVCPSHASLIATGIILPPFSYPHF